MSAIAFAYGMYSSSNGLLRTLCCMSAICCYTISLQYFTMATEFGWFAIEVEFARGYPSPTQPTRQILWIRYLSWSVHRWPSAHDRRPGLTTSQVDHNSDLNGRIVPPRLFAHPDNTRGCLPDHHRDADWPHRRLRAEVLQVGVVVSLAWMTIKKIE
jgi:hypothetical protein